MKKIKKWLWLIIIIIILLGLIGSGCNPKLCPAYDSAVRVKNQKKKSQVDVWNSDFCKPKKRKSSI